MDREELLRRMGALIDEYVGGNEHPQDPCECLNALGERCGPPDCVIEHPRVHVESSVEDWEGPLTGRDWQLMQDAGMVREGPLPDELDGQRVEEMQRANLVARHDTFAKHRPAEDVELPDDLSYEEQYQGNRAEVITLSDVEIQDGITLIRADTRRIPLPDNTVDLIVTSPPYWAQRSYTDSGGEHYDGQIGDEPTPGEYINNMITATKEWARLLKPTGSMWVNLGDKYARTGGVGSGEAGWENRERGGRVATTAMGAPEKSLIGLPWRYALRCIDELGLILREEVIWSKPNGMPESVTDRCRRSHEQWFHFTMNPRYYSAVDRVRIPHAYPLTAAGMASRMMGGKNSIRHSGNAGTARGDATNDVQTVANATGSNILGALPPSVWEIATQGLTVPPELGVDHYAAFPMELPRRIIQGWSPAAVCTVCGEGRRPVKYVARHGGRIRQKIDNRFLGRPNPDGAMPSAHTQDAIGAHAGYVTSHELVGEACACTPYTDHAGTRVGVEARSGDALVPGNTPRSLGAEAQGPWREYHLEDWEPPATRKAVVLDPFGGTGTTALVADTLGRNGVHVDMSADYLRIAEWRTTDPNQRASAMQVPKPPAVMPGQMNLFTLGETP